MEIAYKYCSPHGVAILQNLELKITPPNQFNDPFEFTPNMIWSDPLGRAVDVLRHQPGLKQLFQLEKMAGRFRGSFRDYRKRKRPTLHRTAKEVSRYLPVAAAQVQQQLLDKVSREWGTLCLSKRRDSILMWGHYCDCHRGLVIGFDSSHAIFTGLAPVVYGRDRVVFDATWVTGDPRIDAFAKEMTFSKNEDWSYEQELRQQFELASLKQQPLRDGTPGWFLKLPPKALTNVTLGLRCSEATMGQVQEALKNPSLSHVRLDRVTLDRTKFALQFEPVR